MIKLSILITHYNEPENIVKPLIQSILSQEDVDFNQIEIIIGNDGVENLISDEFFTQFKDIKFKTIPTIIYHIFNKQGISSLRNSLLEIATGEYVMFCDCDDKFISDFGLSSILKKMESNPDIITSCFYEEVYSENKSVHQYQRKEYDRVFVHGKAIRTKFLKDNNIYWDNELTLHEDSYFNNLCYHLAENKEYISQPFYLWKWRDDSVVRKDPLFLIKTYPDVIKSATKLIKQLLYHNKNKDASIQAFASILNLYYLLQAEKYKASKCKDYVKSAMKSMRKFIEEYCYLAENLSSFEQAFVISQVRSIYAETSFTIETITFDDWYNKVMEE